MLGLGLHTIEMAGWVGIDGANVIERTQEAVHLVHALLRGETVPFQGQEYHWTDQCYLRFKPLRPVAPRTPLTSPAALVLGGRGLPGRAGRHAAHCGLLRALP